jgi:ABC-type antimicrobial peptide transport system permease subunit
MALGAKPGDVVSGILGRGVRLTALGVAIGLAASFGLSRLLTTLLYQITATDPLTFVAVPLLLMAVALLASYIPARRATKIDPIAALRHE